VSRAPSTGDYGYHSLREYTGPVAKRAPQPVARPPQLPAADFGGVDDFIQGMADSRRARAIANRHSFERAATVGLVAGLAVAAYNHRRGR
jgi:hypothetical protein